MIDRTGSRPETYPWFRTEIVRRECHAISRYARPGADERVVRREGSVEDFLASEIYPRWFLDPAGDTRVDWADPQATPIPFRDAMRRKDFVRQLMRGFDPELGLPMRIEIVTLHCVGCDRGVVIDGTRRLAWIANLDLAHDTIVDVAELSGSNWNAPWRIATPSHPRCPDIGNVCACPPVAT